MSEEDEYSVVPFLEKENEVIIDRKYKYYSDVSGVMENIQNSEIVIFCTHGTPNEILKYLEKEGRKFEEFVLIDKDNMNVLENKTVVAFCCSSARVLGKQCVDNNNRCKAFVGFENDIVYDNGKAEKSRRIIYKSYKKAFMKSLKYAAESKCTARRFKVVLLQNLRREAAIAILETGNQEFSDLYAGAIDGLVALGNIDEAIFI